MISTNEGATIFAQKRKEGDRVNWCERNGLLKRQSQFSVHGSPPNKERGLFRETNWGGGFLRGKK